MKYQISSRLEFLAIDNIYFSRNDKQTSISFGVNHRRMHI